MERKLASVRKVIDIIPIPGADNIEVAQIDGWKCVVKKGEFAVGGIGVYFEIDSLLPMIPAFNFLANKGVRKMLKDGVEKVGYRLKTIKLRGQLSQGLLLPLELFSDNIKLDIEKEIGYDLTDILGVLKYEAPLPGSLAGKVKGNFPEFLRRTDQERCQNLVAEIKTVAGMLFEITEKLDGTSMTVYLKDGVFGVCSRNLDLLETEGNTHWKVARQLGLEDAMKGLGFNIAIQGELIGEGIQKNPYKLNGQDFRVFDVFDIDHGWYLIPEERNHILNAIVGLSKVPELGLNVPLPENIDTILAAAEGKSMLANVPSEGVVYKSMAHYGNDVFSFKAISNKFLLEEDDKGIPDVGLPSFNNPVCNLGEECESCQ